VPFVFSRAESRRRGGAGPRTSADRRGGGDKWENEGIADQWGGRLFCLRRLVWDYSKSIGSSGLDFDAILENRAKRTKGRSSVGLRGAASRRMSTGLSSAGDRMGGVLSSCVHFVPSTKRDSARRVAISRWFVMSFVISGRGRLSWCLSRHGGRSTRRSLDLAGAHKKSRFPDRQEGGLS
jgi:hypothetical protein